jgi:hypothetical protein
MTLRSNPFRTFALVAGLSLLIPMQGATQMQTPTTTAPAHITNSFDFEVHAPFARVAPLFGPEAERAWAGEHWNPEFIHPQPAHDIQGSVFTIQHGPHTAVWVNTVFDITAGRMQYVYFIPDALVTTVDVALTSHSPSRTAVHVNYTRTALNPAANHDVLSRGESDRTSGPIWQEQIESALGLERR